jgi:hypothetical protein
MDKVKLLSLLAALGLIAAAPTARAATDVRGKVVSIAVTSDCPGEGPCADDVRLATAGDRIITFHVLPDEEMIRHDKVIKLAELAVGNYVSIREDDAVRKGAPTESQTILGD